MQSVGQRIRHREAQGRSLEEIHSSTRISMRSLEAIEQDDVAHVSSAFHYRSFVRQIAAVLGIDCAELEPGGRIDRANSGSADAGRGSTRAEGSSASYRREAQQQAHVLADVVCRGASRVHGILCVPGRFQAEHSKAMGKLAGNAPAAVLPPAPAGMASSGHASPGANPQADAGLLSRKGVGFTVELSATEPVWLSIVEDGKKSFDGVLQRAQTKVLEGHRTARVKTANAGGVEVIFNGRSLGTLGLHGQAKTVLFTKTRYEVLSDSRPVAANRINQSAGLRPPSLPLAIRPAPPALEAGSSNPSAAAASDAPEQ